MSTFIFIDTSIYLSFFSATNDDLNELTNIKHLIHSRKISLIVTSQVERELRRNRDAKIYAAIGEIEKFCTKLPPIPRFMTEYEEVKRLRKSYMELSLARRETVSRAKSEAQTVATKADEVIQQIFDASGIATETDQIIRRAERRMLLGDPPGKLNSIGDRVNWEQMMADIPEGNDLHLISRDHDFRSPLSDMQPHHFLFTEWKEKKKGHLHVHDEIKHFLSSKFPRFNFERDRKPLNSRELSRTLESFETLKVNLVIAQRKQDAFELLRNAEDEEDLINAVKQLEDTMAYMSSQDLKSIIDISLNSSVMYDYGYDEMTREFIASIIPRVMPLLDHKEISAIEHNFDIKIEPIINDDEPELFATNYDQMDVDLLDDIADAEIAEMDTSTRQSSTDE